MCGRYDLHGPVEPLAGHFGLDAWPRFDDHYNIAPSLDVPVIRQSPQGGRVAHLLKWGLVPHGARDPAIGARLHNARAESVAQKPAFRGAWQRRRCLVPASGYYEWQEVAGGRKQPWYIRLQSGEPMALGGLWESWTAPEGGILRSFCIITTAANALLAPIHGRMPVIVPRAGWAAWLDPGNRDAVVPAAMAPLEGWKVSRRVGDAREQGAGLIVPEPGCAARTEGHFISASPSS